jgi:hypothetical protein
MNRQGYDEQTWFTFSYSPLRDEVRPHCRHVLRVLGRQRAGCSPSGACAN